MLMTAPRSRTDRGDKPVTPGEVGMVAGALPPRVGEHPVHLGALLRAVLHADQAAGPQQPCRGLLDDPDRVYAVGATPEGGRGVVHDLVRRPAGAAGEV